jgi:hypothetical protein
LATDELVRKVHVPQEIPTLFQFLPPENPAGTTLGLNPDLGDENLAIIFLICGTIHEPE